MKRILFTLFCLGFFAVSASAMKFTSDREVMLDRNQFLSDDWYVAGEQVDFYGSALKEVFVLASRAQMWGVISQDLNIIAAETDVRGRVGNDLRVVAAEMTVSPTVEGSTLLVGRKIQVQKNAIFNSDVVVMGREISLEGNLQGPVQVEGEQVVVNGIVAGDMQVTAESVTLGPDAKILGKLKVISSKPADVDPKAYLSNPLSWRKSSGDQSTGALTDWFSAGRWYYRMTIFFGLLAAGLILVALLPAASRRYALAIRYRFWASLGWGLFTLAVVPLFLLILLVTVVGIPMAVVLGLFYVGAMFLARMGAGFLLGLLVLRPLATENRRSLLSYLLGFSILSMAGWIPILGGVINFTAILLGMGAIWLAKGLVEPEKKPVESKIESLKPAAVKPVAVREPAATPAPLPVPALPAAAQPMVEKPAMEWQPQVPAFKKTAKKTSRKSPGSDNAHAKPAVRKKAVKKASPNA